ncbi:PREDICTED: uncharacterized protein LOC106808866 [Priapulus caudatus]|uniref:Uncharacterized protein LOC106808866 n=1 Tax=Priapulus caudatus TaxID=37621 RepID=A0ABM1E4W9_PRICU|nr:PREDICTED: uncharacterized protein LOC106808866 [Priapulus caudatus]
MMSNTDRKEQYKCGDHSVQSVRQKIKDTLDESRKESRQALVTSKRFRVSTLPGDVTDLSLVQVRQTASDLKKKSGTNRLSLLKQLTAAFTLHVDNLTEFLGVDGALRSLVSIFTGIDTELQTEAALCLTNLAAGRYSVLCIIRE